MTSTPTKPVEGLPEQVISETPDFKKIQHGLTYKHETRNPTKRNSLPPQKNESLITSPLKRTPLTCVKDSSRNPKKIEEMMLGAKHDLTKLLENAGDKENSSKEIETHAIDVQEVETQEQSDQQEAKIIEASNVETPIRVTIPNEDIQSSPVGSHQKRVSGKRHNESSETSSSKRVHSACTAPSTVDESFQTPLRKQNSKKQTTPCREHHSRLMNDSDIDLMNVTSSDNNPVLDPLNSPLANVSHGMILEEKIDGETEVIDGLRKGYNKKASISDISAIAADSSLDVVALSEGEDEKMSPVKRSGKVSTLDVFDAMIDQDESMDDEEVLQELNGNDLHDSDTMPIFSEIQVEEIKESFNGVVSNLENDLSGKTEEIIRLNNILLEEQNRGKQLNVELNDMTNNYKQTELLKNAVDVELKSTQEFLAKLDKSFTLTKSKLKFQESKVEKLKNVYGQLMSTAKSFEKKILEKTIKIDQLTVKINSLNDEKTQLNNEKIELASTIELKTNEIQNLAQENDLIKENLKKMTFLSESSAKEIESLNNKALETSQQLEDKSTEINQLTELYNESLKKIETLELESAQLNDKLTSYYEEHKGSVNKSTELENQLNELHSKIDSLLKEINNLKESEKYSKELIESLQREQSDLELEKHDIELEKQELQEEVDTQREMMDRMQAQLSEHRMSLDSADRHLKAELLKKQESIDSLNNEISYLKQSLEESAKNHEAKIAEFSTLLDTKNEKLTESTNQISTLKQKISTLENELEQCTVKIEESDKKLEEQLEKLAQDLYVQYSAKHEQKVAILKKGYEMKWVNKCKKLSKENEQMRLELENYKKKLETENNEKKKLVSLWEEYVTLENNERDSRLPDFIKRGNEDGVN
ncbi:hypothetical protein CANARDRAFT_208093 [[Candida] arabinofermentans NRRL YB-2248]|uniref:Uncharacterized protein n=1 Tax=[Candida] arabinofermentans NRRL YB-2248 TaxID=983967 RepID=A0A1E4SZ41_9ASCO|nr:hypothetical protein CANARDRAFT_208093 [[Candida] arabinofermentans NRRL YB-2248]